jgi:phosphoribosylformylglycinamidine cyclo-ligase
VLATIIQGAQKFADKMAGQGVGLHLTGGETADVGDIVRTIDVGFTTFARLRRDKLVVNDIKPGNVIVGLASYGQSTYETEYNGGMGSNGLTSARHDVFKHEYADKYPESFNPEVPREVIYQGSRSLTEQISIGHGRTMSAGKLVLSPTRTYLPVLKVLLDELQPKIAGLIHCTGGAQTKVVKFIDKVRVVKDNLFATPPLFDLLRQESGTDWRELYQVFNMGHRLEVYLPEAEAATVLGIAARFNIDAQVVGYVEAADSPSVRLHTPGGVEDYEE